MKLYKLAIGMIVLLVLLGTNLYAGSKFLPEKQQITGRIHCYEGRYILKEPGKEGACFILLENTALQKILHKIDLLKIYKVEGYVYYLEQNPYLFPVKFVAGPAVELDSAQGESKTKAKKLTHHRKSAKAKLAKSKSKAKKLTTTKSKAKKLAQHRKSAKTELAKSKSKAKKLTTTKSKAKKLTHHRKSAKTELAKSKSKAKKLTTTKSKAKKLAAQSKAKKSEASKGKHKKATKSRAKKSKKALDKKAVEEIPVILRPAEQETT